MKRSIIYFIYCFTVMFVAGCSMPKGSGPAKEPANIPTTESAPAAPISNSGEPVFVVTIHDPAKAYNGTTLLTDGYQNRLVEVDMKGKVVWEYSIPDELIKGPLVGFEGEVLSNGNILLSISNSGLYEIDRSGKILWTYSDPKVSHDADRLKEGSTIYVFGNWDTPNDEHVKVVSADGNIKWSWSASDDYLSRYPEETYSSQGWVHINGVQRLSNGNTMVSLRNFFLTTVLDADGEIVREYDWSSFGQNTDPHEPVMYENTGTLMVCLQNDSPYIAVEINAQTEEIIWSYADENIRTARDCNKLPNGNYLILGVDQGGTENNVNMDDDTAVIFEVTRDGEVVWRMEYQNNPVGNSPGWFFKAERFGK